MRNSRRASQRRSGAVLLSSALLLLPFGLACGFYYPGDRDALGCPAGETCGAYSGASFAVSAPARDCRPVPIEIWAVDAEDLFAFYAPPPPAWFGVALGGVTSATVGTLRIGERTEWTAHFRPIDGTTQAVAIALGEGRFELREPGGLVNYVTVPVRTATQVFVTDGLACPDQEPVLLRGVSFVPEVHLYDASGRPLVDLSARAMMLTGELEVRPGRIDEIVFVRVRYAGSHERLLEFPVVDEATDLRMRLGPADRLRRVPLLRGLFPGICFEARAGTATILGARVDGVSVDGDDVTADVSFLAPHCVDVTRTDPEEAAVAELTRTLTVTMAGLTRTFEVALPAEDL